MDLPRNDRPTPEMVFAAAVWVLLALLVICFTDPDKAREPQQTKTAQTHKPLGGSQIELR